MHDLSDTIAAVSSPIGGVRSIVRVSGPEAMPACEQLSGISDLKPQISNPRIECGRVRIGDGLTIEARLYLFFSPHSYTGDDLVEIHTDASEVIVVSLMQSLLAAGLRAAGPGEFTARAYLNGRLDLVQAEAVNEIIVSSNKLQLEAAEKVLTGRLKQTLEAIRSELMDCLSLIEAGLDFSDGELGPARPIGPVLGGILGRLENLLADSIQCQTLVDLPTVGIAGLPNAGKSSLLNALLGCERSIVSHEPMTTRDVLTGLLTTDRAQCVLFDCAGLAAKYDNSLDALSQRAAIEALQHCQTVLFCVDATKTHFHDEIEVRALIGPKRMIHVATKSDSLPNEELSGRMQTLAGAFSADFVLTSAKTRQGLQDVVHAIEDSILKESESTSGRPSIGALTANHRQMVSEAIEDVRQAITEEQSGREEVAATMIRSAWTALSQTEHQPIDEQVLDRIFSRFCIGK